MKTALLAALPMLMLCAKSAWADEKDTPNTTVKGVGGWLTLFIVFSVLTLILFLYHKSKGAVDAYTAFSALKPGLLLYIFILWSYILTYFYALYRLLFVKKGAVRFIKNMLISKPLFTVLSPCITSLCLLPMTDSRHFIQLFLRATYNESLFYSVAVSLLTAALWYWYFTVSVRVKNTWPEHFSEAETETGKTAD